MAPLKLEVLFTKISGYKQIQDMPERVEAHSVPFLSPEPCDFLYSPLKYQTRHTYCVELSAFCLYLVK